MARRLRQLRSHGITREAECFVQHSDGPWHYEQQALGFNYRMTDLQAALGLSQMTQLDDFVARRRALAERYAALLKGLPLSLQAAHPDSESAFHLRVVRLQLEEIGIGRAEIAAALRQRQVLTNVHYRPVHTQPYYQTLGFAPGDFPEAERYARDTLSLPLYPALTDAQQDHVAQALREVLCP